MTTSPLGLFVTHTVFSPFGLYMHGPVVPEPAGPVGPCGPVAPVAPGVPTPVAPVAPVAPFAPVAPVLPVAPVAPAWPPVADRAANSSSAFAILVGTGLQLPGTPGI